MKLNCIGPFVVNAPFGTEIAFAKGLRRIGHEVNEIDPNKPTHWSGLDMDADATVVFKSCVGQEWHLTGLRNVVVYQPDDARFKHIREMMWMMRQYAPLLLSFDDHGAEVAKTMGYRAAETLLLTADDELYCPSPTSIERDIDVSFIGSLGDPVAHASRRKMVEIVNAESLRRGWVFKYGTTQDVPTILDVYRRSKVVLNHATDVGQGFGQGYGLQCRHFEVGMTRTPLLTNYSNEPFPCSHFGHEDTLIERIADYVSGARNVESAGSLIYDQIREHHLPQHRAAQLVSFIERNS